MNISPGSILLSTERFAVRIWNWRSTREKIFVCFASHEPGRVPSTSWANCICLMNKSERIYLELSGKNKETIAKFILLEYDKSPTSLYFFGRKLVFGFAKWNESMEMKPPKPSSHSWTPTGTAKLGQRKASLYVWPKIWGSRACRTPKRARWLGLKRKRVSTLDRRDLEGNWQEKNTIGRVGRKGKHSFQRFKIVRHWDFFF